MSTTELNVVWFAQPAFAHLVERESNLQLNENVFDSSEMIIDAMSISEQSSKRFKSLRAINVDGQYLYPAKYFQTADDFGEQFLSHAVYSSLFDQYIFKLRTADKKLLHNSVLGEVQNRFYMASSPDWFFRDRAEWDSRTLKKQVQKFLIERPHEKVRDYVHRRRIKVKREIETGGITEAEVKNYERYKMVWQEGAETNLDGGPTAVEAQLNNVEIMSLFEKLSGLERKISDKKLVKDLLDLQRVLSLFRDCSKEPVTPSDYQQFMIDWEKTPKPIRGATEIQKILWKWLYVSFPDDRNKYFHKEGESETVINKKTQARSRRLKGLNEFLKNAVMEAILKNAVMRASL